MLLHVPLYLIFDDGILVGINMNASAMAVDVTRCHVSVAMNTLDLVREPWKFERFDMALLFDDFLGLVTDRCKYSSFLPGNAPPSILVSLVIARPALSNEKSILVESDHESRLLLDYHQIGGHPLEPI